MRLARGATQQLQSPINSRDDTRTLAAPLDPDRTVVQHGNGIVAPRSPSTPKLALAAEPLLKFGEVRAWLKPDIEEEQALAKCLPCAVLPPQLRLRRLHGLYVGQRPL